MLFFAAKVKMQSRTLGNRLLHAEDVVELYVVAKPRLNRVVSLCPKDIGSLGSSNARDATSRTMM